MTAQKDPNVIRIAVTPSAKAVIVHWAESQGMTQIAVASRIYQWFSVQPEVVQRGVLGMFGDEGPDIVKMVLERMEASAATANGPPGKKLTGEEEAPKQRRKRA